LRVYGKGGDPCQTCETPIKKVTVAQRSTHYCPNCQS
jgi:formamidopyrimidine-DNA glycosylase